MPPDFHLDILAIAARSLVKHRLGIAHFDLHEVARLATNFTLGQLLPGSEDYHELHFLLHSAEDDSGISWDDLLCALELCKLSTQWYDSMIDAENKLWNEHGEKFVPRGDHPCQLDPHSLGPAQTAADFERLEADYYGLRHVTCRHSDCTGDYCKRVRKNKDGKEETYCRFDEKLRRHLDASGASLPTHFYATAEPKKGQNKNDPPTKGQESKVSSTKEKAQEATKPPRLADGVIRWRLYVEKDDPFINTTHPTQSRGCRSNNDFVAAIDKFGLVNYVTKAKNYISKQEKHTKSGAGILLTIAQQKEFDVRSTVRSLLFSTIDRDICAQEMNAIAQGFGPFRTNITQVRLRWAANERVVKACNSKVKRGVRTRFNDMEVYWNRDYIMRHQLDTYREKGFSEEKIELFERCIGWSLDMSAAEFYRHFSVTALDCGPDDNEEDCWRIEHRENIALTVVVVTPDLPDGFRRLPVKHADHERFCRMRLTTHLAVGTEDDLLTYVTDHGGSYASAYSHFIAFLLHRSSYPDFDRKGRVALMDQTVFEGAEMEDEQEGSKIGGPAHHFDGDMDSAANKSTETDGPKCPSSSVATADEWSAHRLFFGLHNCTDDELRNDWIVALKVDPDVNLRAREVTVVPLSELNAEQRFSVSINLDWFYAWAAKVFYGSQVPLPKPIRMMVYGCGGVGKSEVLKATCDAIDKHMDELRAERIAAGGVIDGPWALTSADLVLVGAPTGVAAVAVGGSTIHTLAALGSGRHQENSEDKALFRNLEPGGQALKRLQRRYENAIFMFQDEVGMTDASTFGKEDARLTQAKLSESNPTPGSFGGLNMILFGHHAQLPPVNGDRLYCRKPAKTGDLCATKGIAAYSEFTTVVILREQMRQRAAATTLEK